MKQETKQTIDWIKKQINLAKENCINPAHKDGYPEYEDDYEKAMSFLDSLPEIESKLCQGGYIQDANGKPCCNGDEVIFSYYADCTNIPKKKGVLRWSPFHRFIIIVNNEEYDFMDNEIIEFEKVE